MEYNEKTVYLQTRLRNLKRKYAKLIEHGELAEEAIELKPLERKLIPTGLKIELEHGYEAQIRPRSGLSIKHGITLINCVGTIDEDYRGEVCVPIVNISNEAYTIQPDERIAQMVIARAEQAKLEVVTELTDTERGEGGFGSTGK